MIRIRSVNLTIAYLMYIVEILVSEEKCGKVDRKMPKFRATAWAWKP